MAKIITSEREITEMEPQRVGADGGRYFAPLKRRIDKHDATFLSKVQNVFTPKTQYVSSVWFLS